MTKGVECLLCKCKALSSNPRLTKKRKKERKEIQKIKRNMQRVPRTSFPESLKEDMSLPAGRQ
jgi:hypothetical protein